MVIAVVRSIRRRPISYVVLALAAQSRHSIAASSSSRRSLHAVLLQRRLIVPTIGPTHSTTSDHIYIYIYM